MERYFCDCLNIIIHVNDKETRESNGSDLLSDELKAELKQEDADPFFSGKLLDVKLAISGIEVSQPTLSKDRCFGDWLISTCLSCGVDTHAVHASKGADRVFLSRNIHHGLDELNEIKDSHLFSTFLKMKLVPASDRTQNNKCLLSQTTISEAMEKITESSQRLIQAEEDAKNERIRVFAENENHKMREYRIKANRDKEYLLRILRERDTRVQEHFDSFGQSSFYNENKTETETDDHLADLPSIALPTINIQTPSSGTRRRNNPGGFEQLLSSSAPSRSKVGGHSHSFGLSHITSGSLGLVSKSGGGAKQASSKNKGPSLGTSMKEDELDQEKKLFQDDILFDMEGYNNQDAAQPFFESDDESEGESTSLEGSGGFMGGSASTRSIPMVSPGGAGLKPNGQNSTIYASSVPVPVPLFNNMRDSYDPDSDDEKQKSSPSLSKLAISFKQVARSMQDSTGVFGELPSRRKEYSNEFLFDEFK